MRLAGSPDMVPLNFRFFSRDGARIWVDGDFAAAAFVDSLARIDRWFDDAACQIVKDQEKTKVGRLKIAIAGHERSVFLKQFNARPLRYWLAFLVPSRARKALRGAAILRAANIPIALPVAAVEKREWRARGRSFFVTREVVGGKTADVFWHEVLGARTGPEGFRKRRAFLRGLAELFRALHAQRIYHNDLKDANVLARNGPERSVDFFLLDLEGVARCLWLSERRKIKNLIQLNRSLGRHLSRAEKIYFLKSYLGPAFFDRRRKRRLISKVLRRSRRLEAQKAGLQRASAESRS